MTPPLHYQPVVELRRQLVNGDISATELIQHFINRHDEVNEQVHGIVTLAREQALADAARIDSERSDGSLAGIPIVIKDVIPTRHIRTTYNSYVKGENWIADDEPEFVTRLRKAGAIVLGKANANEFLGIPSDSDRFPRPRSPYNRDYVSIGSSSGSGVSVAAGLCAASIGTDGAGSVRLPAGQHGLVGLKATNGTITRAGMGRHNSLQVVGALTRTVADTMLFHGVLADTTEPPLPQPDVDVRGLRVGVPWRYIETAPVEQEILSAFRDGLDVLKQRGATIVDIPLRGLAEARLATFVVLYTEHHTGHQNNLSNSYGGFGASARLYAMQGAFISAVDYHNALELGRKIRDIVDRVFDDIDIIALPTSPFVTAEAARRPAEHRQGINTVFTGPFNLTGHPAITVPCGIAEIGIPIGMQFVGKHRDEATLLKLSFAYEQATNWHTLHPNL